MLAVQFGILVPAGDAASGPTTVSNQGTPRLAATLVHADVLAAVVSGVQAAFDQIGSETAATALGPTTMAGDATWRIIPNLALALPAAIDATAVTKMGIVLTVEPGDDASAEGASISAQEQAERLSETQRPIMSEVFKTVEGVNATVSSPRSSSRRSLSTGRSASSSDRRSR